MLLSLKAGGTGLNLTAADHVFLLDPWWNPAVEDQAADRAHRIGQDTPVMVYRLVAQDTVEERILELQERKRALADAALGEARRRRRHHARRPARAAGLTWDSARLRLAARAASAALAATTSVSPAYSRLPARVRRSSHSRSQS